MVTDFEFDPRTLRYRNKSTGRLVGLATIKDLVNKQIEQYQQENRAIATDLFEGRLSLGEWESDIAQNIKDLNLQLYKLGAGQMEYRDYGIVGRRLRREYGYLRKFSAEMALGQLTENQITARLDQYAAAARGMFERGRREGFSLAGATYERRILNSKVPCAQCPQYAALGWQPKGILQNIGEGCDCRSNCKCSFEYSFSQNRPDNQSLLELKFGWVG
jgi:hypothetical protein